MSFFKAARAAIIELQRRGVYDVSTRLLAELPEEEIPANEPAAEKVARAAIAEVHVRGLEQCARECCALAGIEALPSRNLAGNAKPLEVEMTEGLGAKSDGPTPSTP